MNKQEEFAPVTSPGLRFWTVPQLARTGLASESTILRWCRQGRLSAIQAGRTWRIPNDVAQRVLTHGLLMGVERTKA